MFSNEGPIESLKLLLNSKIDELQKKEIFKYIENFIPSPNLKSIDKIFFNSLLLFFNPSALYSENILKICLEL